MASSASSFRSCHRGPRLVNLTVFLTTLSLGILRCCYAGPAGDPEQGLVAGDSITHHDGHRALLVNSDISADPCEGSSLLYNEQASDSLSADLAGKAHTACHQSFTASTSSMACFARTSKIDSLPSNQAMPYNVYTTKHKAPYARNRRLLQGTQVIPCLADENVFGLLTVIAHNYAQFESKVGNSSKVIPDEYATHSFNLQRLLAYRDFQPTYAGCRQGDGGERAGGNGSLPQGPRDVGEFTTTSEALG